MINASEAATKILSCYICEIWSIYNSIPVRSFPRNKNTGALLTVAKSNGYNTS